MQLKNKDLWREQAFINGHWVDRPQTQVVYDPATLKIIGRIPELTIEDITVAIADAERAFCSWRAIPAEQRARVLRHWFTLILENQMDLAQILTLEQGKPLAEAQGEVVYAANFIEWFAEEGKRIYGNAMPVYRHDARSFIVKGPVGVTAAITPWNFPIGMITRKCAPALAAGCTTIVKPAPETPFTALALAVLAQQAGIPDGVFNVVTGAAETIGRVLTTSPVVRKLSFTGSTAVGRLLMRDSANTVKKLSLELGGNAPFIVFADADLPRAIEGAMTCKYRNSGQTCVCVNRFLVERSLHDDFVTRLCARVKNLKVGNGFDPDTTQGPLINRAAVEKVEKLLQDALIKGARLEIGGHPLTALGENFFEPTVLSQVDRSAALMQTEIFGPLAAVVPFDSEEEAIMIANDTDYGLAAYFYSNDIKRTWRLTEALEYGIVCANESTFSSVYASFGGVKQSGLGREGSIYGIEEYLESKYLLLGGLT